LLLELLLLELRLTDVDELRLEDELLFETFAFVEFVEDVRVRTVFVALLFEDERLSDVPTFVSLDEERFVVEPSLAEALRF
jgi:hypothetical protein